MAFIYELEYKVHSVIEDLSPGGLPVGEPEISITSHSGFMKLSECGTLINYNEECEGGDRVFTEIEIFGESRVRLTRRGAINSEIIFGDEDYKTLYTVGGYTFDMTVETKKIRSNLTKDGGELQLIYKMTVGGAVRQARMKITASKRRQNA